ncbi:hypothetical protein INR49_007268 [Caranx melampygus]|nr:hypothetical protein INR49_007268 [Caranx melampygus]
MSIFCGFSHDRLNTGLKSPPALKCRPNVAEVFPPVHPVKDQVSLSSGPQRVRTRYDDQSSRHPKAFPLRPAWVLSRLLLRTGRSRLKMVSWSLSSSDSDIIRLELCSVLRCLIPAQRKRMKH